MWLLDEVTDTAVLGDVSDELTKDYLNALGFNDGISALVSAGYNPHHIGLRSRFFSRIERPSPDDFAWWSVRLVGFIYADSSWRTIEASSVTNNYRQLYTRLWQDARSVLRHGARRGKDEPEDDQSESHLMSQLLWIAGRAS